MSFVPHGPARKEEPPALSSNTTRAPMSALAFEASVHYPDETVSNTTRVSMSALAPPTTSARSVEPALLNPDTVVLFFGNDWFAENRTSSHHIARQLAKRFQVYYVECPGWRAPRGSGRDLKKVFVKLWRFLKGTRTVEGGMRLRTLFQIPFHGRRGPLAEPPNYCRLGWMKWRNGSDRSRGSRSTCHS